MDGFDHDHAHVDQVDRDHDRVDHDPFDYGHAHAISSYQPHLYRDRTRTKVLWRTLSFTLPKVSPVKLPKVSSVKHCKVTLSGALRTVATLSIISPKSPYFLQNFIS